MLSWQAMKLGVETWAFEICLLLLLLLGACVCVCSLMD